MAHLPMPLWFPCLNPIEQEAIRLFYYGRPPLYFVTPVQPITDWFNAVPYGFTERQSLWEQTFGFTRGTVEILGVEFEVYFDPQGYYEEWQPYFVVGYPDDPPPCKILEYSLQ